MDQTDAALLGIMSISSATLIALAWAALEPSLTKRGGIYFLRFGRLRLTLCRTQN